jgi:hypothetical protein
VTDLRLRLRYRLARYLRPNEWLAISAVDDLRAHAAGTGGQESGVSFAVHGYCPMQLELMPLGVKE